MARTKDAPGTTLPEIAWNILTKAEQEEVMILRASCLYQVKDLADKYHLPQKIYKQKFEEWLASSEANREMYRAGEAKKIVRDFERASAIKKEINRKYFVNKKLK